MFRFTRRGTAAGFLLLLGMLVSRVALATDIVSPASVNDDTEPRIQLNRTTLSTPYQWILSGHDVYFYLSDVTGGTYPFFIDAGSATDLLHLSGNNVGIGTGFPAAGLHLRKKAQASTAEIMARFETDDDAIGGLFIANNSAGDGVFVPKITGRSGSTNAALITEAIISNDLGSSPAIAYNAAKGAGGPLVTRPLVTYRNNSVAKVTIAANGVVTATSFNPVSSRTMKHDIENLDSREAANALHQLVPVTFLYNDDESHEKRVGFIAEDVPEIVAATDRQSVPIMDVVAVMARVLKDQQQTIEEERKINLEQRKAHKAEAEAMLKRLDALERRLAEVR